jgi:DNA-binding MarR family transcriptional regulator
MPAPTMQIFTDGYSLLIGLVTNLPRVAGGTLPVGAIMALDGQQLAMNRKSAVSRAAPHRHFSTGVRVIERAISPDGAPVIGLHLYMACTRLARSMSRGSKFAGIKPAAIGIPALLNSFPGLSQTELADLLGIERMTAGLQVQQCIRTGLVRRQRSTEDRRKYRLYVTGKGRARLRRITKLIPLHEQYLFGRLSVGERKTLHRLLQKVIDAEVSGDAVSS